MTTTYNYRYLDLETPLAYIGRKGCLVWYYRTGDKAMNLCRRPEDRPKDAVAAVVASVEDFTDGEPMGRVVYEGDKDPIPPPPPPPWRNDLSKYLANDAAKFFSGTPRGTTA